MPTYFIVRATVADPAKRAAFDAWYSQGASARRREDVRRAEGVAVLERERSRGASGDVSVGRPRGARSRGNGDGMKRLVADFDRDWPGIPRQREIMTLVEEFDGTARDAVMRSGPALSARLDAGGAASFWISIWRRSSWTSARCAVTPYITPSSAAAIARVMVHRRGLLAGCARILGSAMALRRAFWPSTLLRLETSMRLGKNMRNPQRPKTVTAI